ncbi:nucleotide exchange factor GrpE [[Acholeplasma] multilocale]|uniref:nucleotide exchange factor GrpE n=1 Tax=[Acholeplasma] multilocale TaxID=264638 RepID=UPI0003F67016|nr:nucleotide exchange factor GrpE [[Acholeplasma] multilocale]
MNKNIPEEILELVNQLSDEVVKADETEETKPSEREILLEFINKQQEQIEELTKKIEEEELMYAAKVQTLTRRHNEENTNSRKYGSASLAEDIIKPIDLFKKVLAAPAPSEEVKNYLFGFEMIAKQLEQSLENNGITMIEVKPGDEFDSNIHNANEAVEGTKFKENQVVQVISNGYKIHDRVLVHAIVKVAK